MAPFAAAVGLGAVLSAAHQPPAEPRLSMHVAVPPVVVPMAGQRWLIYELHLENRGQATVTLTSLEVAGDAAPSTPLATFEGDALARRLDAASPSLRPLDVPAAGRRVVYIEVALAPGPEPEYLRHHVRFASASIVGGVVGGIPGVRVDPAPPVVLGPPLAGGPWAAVHRPDWERGHRRVFYTVDGVTRLPGRYTIDFVKLDQQGRTTGGDADLADLVHLAAGYGEVVLAVADGTVAAARGDMPEPARLSARVKHPQEEAAGNYLSLDIGDGRFAVYEHLKPESLRVTVGDRVRRGDVIAELGFTGDSTGPHLHLHVGDAASPLAAEGHPFVFERFEALGRYPDIGAMGTARWSPEGAGTRQRERPGPNVVVDFGAAGTWPERLPLIDEADRCAGFAPFRRELLRIIDRQDGRALLRHVAADVRLGFDGERGHADFRRFHLSSAEQRQELWHELGSVLRLGGGCESPDTFVAPYVTSHWPGGDQLADLRAVVGDDVPMRVAPRPDAAVTGRLSRAIVRVTDYVSAEPPWSAVAAPDGRHGFVEDRFLRSPIDMRAQFERRNGRWLLAVWIGGD